MPASTLVSAADYLATSYRPDVEYLEGRILERNVGEYDHSRPQGLLVRFLGNREKEWGIRVVPEQRVQVRRDRYRVPDVCVVRAETPIEAIFITPPFLCIEILSKDDSMTEMQERVDDYLAMGVPYVWVIDPRRRRAYAYTSEGMREIGESETLRTSAPDIAVPLSAIFE